MEINKILKGDIRDEAIEQGYLDGRFRTKVVPDKKKEQRKKACRNFKGKEEGNPQEI